MSSSSWSKAVPVAIFCITLGGCSVQSFVMKQLFVPSVEFDPQSIPEAPDYARSAAWVSHPDIVDNADLRLPGAAEPVGEVPVFFVHPTTFLDRRSWLEDPAVEHASLELLEQVFLPSMVSMFNECCDIYVPRYRAATLGTFYVPPEQATPVFAVAYEDVERAFSFFIEHHASSGPFMIASHSQGAMHARRLLRRVDSDSDLGARLVVAYVPGHEIPLSAFGSEFEQLTPCVEVSQIGCIASWNTVGHDFDADAGEGSRAWNEDSIVIQEREPIACTNPVTGTHTTARVASSRHRGGILTQNSGQELDQRKLLSGEFSGLHVTGLEAPLGGLVSTQCDDSGRLRVDEIRTSYPPASDDDGHDYHFYDLALFYLDVQEDSLRRIESWQRRNTSDEQ